MVHQGREYVNDDDARIGFVATNSITQGEQVAQLWPILFKRCKLEIAFAHRTFAWGSDARGTAHVHVVILGFDGREAARAEKRLFSYPDIKSEAEESRHAALSPYLFDAGGLSDPHLVVRKESAPINGMDRLIIGSKPIDGGNYIFDAKECAQFLESEPEATPWLRPFIGAREHLQGGERWILALHDAPPEVLARLPRVRERIAAVREFREASKSAPTQKLAPIPTLYHVNVIPTTSFLVVPKVSSERREYVPTGWLEPPVIPSDLVFVLQGATHADFALLTSCHAHGVAAPYRWTAQERLPLFHRPCLQHLSDAAQGCGPVETGTAGAGGARLTMCPSWRDVWRISMIPT